MEGVGKVVSALLCQSYEKACAHISFYRAVSVPVSTTPLLEGVMGRAGPGNRVKDQCFLRQKKNVKFEPPIFSSN